MHPGDMQPNNMPYPENEENFPMDHPRNEERHHDSWRTYSEEMEDGPRNEMHPENGNFPPNPDMRHGFEQHNNVGPPNRGRPDRFHPHPMRGEEEFLPDNMPPRGGPPPYGDNIFPGGDVDHRNNHMGPGPDDMGFMPHKRSWNDGPREDHFPPRDFDGPMPPNFNSRDHMRSGPMYHRPPRGSRGHFRGRSSPYRIINRGRGRGYKN